MDLRLQLLETFVAMGSDGARHKVCAYDRLARDPSMPGEQWTSTGVVEYRLGDGRRVDVRPDGSASVDGANITLDMPQRAAMAPGA